MDLYLPPGHDKICCFSSQKPRIIDLHEGKGKRGDGLCVFLKKVMNPYRRLSLDPRSSSYFSCEYPVEVQWKIAWE
jgi:hypothetical protein